jgi:L-fuculose-phosphate aldolase
MSTATTTIPNLDFMMTEIIEVGRYLASRQYHAALAGNISRRVSENLLLCTRHGADKGALTGDDLVLCDLNGVKVEGKGDPTSEMNMHRMSYRLRPDVNAVIHAHPPTATGFAAASVPLDQLMLPEMVVLLGSVALVPYATPGSEDLARQLAKFLPAHDGFLLENHGALTVGGDLRQAALRMELIEHNAQITLVVRQIGKPFKLSEEEMENLLAIRRRMGLDKKRTSPSSVE